MKDKDRHTKAWFSIPAWIILGAVVILAPIFVFWTIQNIHKQKENTTHLLAEKGAALIRAFEAGTRTGMMGMMGNQGGRFQLQRLLTETAQQTDIVSLIVTDAYGKILAHNDPMKIGEIYGRGLDLEKISRAEEVQWRQISNPGGGDIFEVFRLFTPTRPHFTGRHNRWMQDLLGRYPGGPQMPGDNSRLIIFVGLDMGPIEEARKEDIHHTVLMAVILCLIGFAGIVSLFLAQAYRSARTSLTRIKAFSDNVVENMPIGLLAVDAEGMIASFNQTAESILRLSSNDVLGRRSVDILPQEFSSLMEEAENHGRTLMREMECLLRDERKIPLDVSVSMLQGDNGIFLGHLLLFRDLTEIQELKKEVERSQRLASLGRLAAGVAHEIRNPLSSIKGFATYFRDRYKDIPEDQKTAEILIQEVDRLNRVITQLLEFARPMAIQKKSGSIESLIQHTLKMVEGQARSKDIKIDASFSSEIGEVPMDPDRMNQVFLNVYLNAIEAMEGGGVLSVALAQEEDARRVKIVISDTGIGMKKKDLVHILDPYFTTKQSGTGLGLAIVHRIIEAHQGEIRVESEEGNGTRVIIYLPYV
ncbi:MAG: ATP-binding protein [Pseudomonadota bacterium]